VLAKNTAYRDLGSDYFTRRIDHLEMRKRHLTKLPPDPTPHTTSRGSNQSPPGSVNRRSSALSKPHPQVITVSEPSAEAARRANTGRSIPARSRSSATHNDTPKHADARPIRVHTRRGQAL
jgi:hypothetical protein